MTSMGTLETHHPADLALYHRNPKVGDVDAIAASLRVNHQYRPIVVNRGTHTGREMEVLAGNHTLKAFRDLAEKHPEENTWQFIDCYVIDVDDDRAARIVAADNRTAELGSMDDRLLLELLSELDDLDGTGYDLEDLEALEALTPPIPETDPNDAPEPRTSTRCKRGQSWRLGPHRLLVGDATDTDRVLAWVGDDPADCVWTDPPYGVDYVGKTAEALTIKNDGNAGLSELLSGAYRTIAAATRPGAPVYVAHADTERVVFETCARDAGLVIRQNLVWVKNTIVLGRSDYHYRHEPILYGFTPGGEGRLGRGGDRWYGDDAQATTFFYDKPARNGEHPTMKPVELVAHMISNSCRPGGLVFDPFGGSGSTMAAAHITGRRANLVELDPAYAQVIIERYEAISGDAAILEEEGHEERGEE